MLQFEELKLELEGLKPEIDDLADALGLKSIMSEIEQLEHRAAEPGFWDDMEGVNCLGKIPENTPKNKQSQNKGRRI